MAGFLTHVYLGVRPLSLAIGRYKDVCAYMYIYQRDQGL